MIGTLWHSKRYLNAERILLVVREQEYYYPNHNGYLMLDLMSGRELLGFAENGKMHLPATGSIELDPFE